MSTAAATGTLSLFDFNIQPCPVVAVQPQPEPQPVAAPPKSKLADSFYAMADRMQGEIQRKRDSNSGVNLTRKRLEQQRHAHAEADRLEVHQKILRALADARLSLTLPLWALGVKTKEHLAQLALLVEAPRDYQQSQDRQAGRTVRQFYYTWADWSRHDGDPRIPDMHTEEDFNAAQAWVQAIVSGSEQSAHARERKLQLAEKELCMQGYEDLYPTPPEVVETMRQWINIRRGNSILEPHAGTGTLAWGIWEPMPDDLRRSCTFTLNERAYTLSEFVKQRFQQEMEVYGSVIDINNTDFLEMSGRFDRIVMNPPFSNGLDMVHVKHAYSLLKPGGRLVSVMATGWQSGGKKAAMYFRGWLDEHGGQVIDLPRDAFQRSIRPVGVGTCLVIMDRKGE